jgi:hypothetical protein
VLPELHGPAAKDQFVEIVLFEILKFCSVHYSEKGQDEASAIA